MLATLWYPSSDLIGPGSLLPATGIALYVTIVHFMHSRELRLTAPVVYLSCAIFTSAVPFAGRVFPDADDFLGYDLLIVAACASAWRLPRDGSLLSLLVGGAALLIAGLAAKAPAQLPRPLGD